MQRGGVKDGQVCNDPENAVRDNKIKIIVGLKKG